MNNNPINNLSASQLHQAAAIKDKIDALEKDLSQILSGAAPKAKRATPKRKRAKAKVTKKGTKATKKQAKTTKKQAKPKRTMSPAARKKLSQAAKARWAKAKKQGKNKL